ncbi:MAG: tRNA uridine 5-carboxymethylaminomethyl modification enzyme [Planctomycetota bacterium]|jgi:tRNA uridine 5-carboxymethylaminomethyl modification enzyme
MTTHLHPHPFPEPNAAPYDVLVVGGGHAGVEAALAAARLGARTGLISFSKKGLGEMSCNPAIGGLGKGQLVREVDALGGIMGIIADATGIQFKMLNTAKGFAVQAPRCQSDRHRYRDAVVAHVATACERYDLEVIEAEVKDLVATKDGKRIEGVLLGDGTELRSAATILTTGTFLGALMYRGDEVEVGGRAEEPASIGLTGALAKLGLELGRLKTGTPARIARDSVDWTAVQPESGDAKASPFSFSSFDGGDFVPALEQVACHITWTNPATHALIAENVHLAPMYAGKISGTGPRYCPSVEDKVMRFADRDRHQIFLEPEGLETDAIYLNGLSTSLPRDVQDDFLRTITGLEKLEFQRHGYAVEYDYVLPAQLDPTLAVGAIAGLYLGGQINGTSGYEEAAAQGLIAGTNAALWCAAREPFLLERHEAYIGVLVDDLVVSRPTEPYRMFSSRAEYRLLLRQDDADRRLVARGHAIGLVSDVDLERMEGRYTRIEAAKKRLESTKLRSFSGKSAADVLRRPEITLDVLESDHNLEFKGLTRADRVTLEADIKYAGYIKRQQLAVDRATRQESTPIPPEFNFAELSGLRGEAAEKLADLRPRTLGAASRIAGINPPDIALLAVHIERQRARS